MASALIRKSDKYKLCLCVILNDRTDDSYKLLFNDILFNDC